MHIARPASLKKMWRWSGARSVLPACSHVGRFLNGGNRTRGMRHLCGKSRACAHAPHTSGKKKRTKINFLDPETVRWGGGLPREGVVANKFVLSLESLSSLGFAERNLGCPGNLPGCPRPLGVFKKFVQKKFVRIFRSLTRMTHMTSLKPLSLRCQNQGSLRHRRVICLPQKKKKRAPHCGSPCLRVPDYDCLRHVFIIRRVIVTH